MTHCKYLVSLVLLFSLPFASYAKRQSKNSEREYWENLAYKIAQPVLEPMSQGKLQSIMQTEFSPSFDNRNRKVLFMECFGRLMAGIAPWLQVNELPGSKSSQLREWALAAYRNAVDSSSADYLCWGSGGQNLVDAAYIAESWAKEREAWRNYSISWAEHNNWMGATESNPALWRYRDYGEDQQHVLFGDWQICFQTYIDLYHTLKDERCIARAKEVMDYEVDSKEADYWWWADALYMVMPVMTKMYRLTGSEKYLDKLYANICYSDSIMLDTATGLYYRDARYVYPRHKTLDGRKDFWACGNGWVLAGLAKVLQDVPRNYQHHSFFAEKFRRLAKAVAAQQQPEGYWSRSLMDAAQAPGPETSGTAFFVYGLLWGINNGYLSAADFMPTVKKAWSYLMYTALQPDGSIGYVQPIGDRAIPGQTIGRQSQADFGVGAFLLAACEYARWVSRK